MKQKLLSFFLLCMVLIGVVHAQERRISGKVTDANTQPLPGVSVVASESRVSTQTDADGNYSLVVPSSATSLHFSYIGFVPEDITIGTEAIINVTLKTLDQSLDEVVITGYSEIRRNQFAGSATTISAAATIENRPLGSFTQVLQGRVPGMLVNSGSGQPGANAQITIRGVQSIQGAGAQPLFIIDGVPTSSEDFQSVNPNDFESVTVLKDANAAALYGARAGTGVIVITTKQGKEGATEILAKVQVGAAIAPDFSRLNLMNTSELLEYEERVGLMTGSTSLIVPGWVWSRRNPANANLSETELARFDRLLDSTRAINTDLRDVFFRTGLSQTYEVNARGGNNKTQFFISGSYFGQDGIDRTSGLKRYSGRINLAHNENKLKIQWNTLASYSQLDAAVGDLLGNSPLNPFQMIYRARPYDNPYLADGTLNYGGGGTNLNLKQVANVLERNMHTRDPRKQMKINSGLTLSYDITDDLQIRNTLGLDVSNTLRETYIDPGTYSGSLQRYQNGLAREYNYIYSQLVNTSSINYSKTFADRHALRVGAYFEAIRVHEKGMGFELFNLNPGLINTGQGASDLPTEGAATLPQNASSARSGYGIRSYFANAEYTFDDRITVNANIRRDGTSRIVNPANKEITTWSAGAIWNISEEKFMANQNIFSSLNLRLSYGIVPNIGSISTSNYQIPPGFTQAGSIAVTNYAGSQVPAFNTTNYPGSTLPGLRPTAPGNENLKIEQIQKTNLGIDFSVWQSRARFTIDLYNNRTVDLFVRQPLSGITGFPNLDINAGVMTNKGIEASFDIDLVRTADFRLGIGMNHSINVNKIEDLGIVDEYFLGTFVIREGLPYGTHYTQHYLGADPETGRPTYATLDGGTTLDVAEAGQFATFGTYLPKHIGGFNIDFSYKRFTVNANFSYQFDVVRSNNTRNWITDGAAGYVTAVNQSRELLTDQWLQPGDNAFFPSPAYSKGFTSADLQNAKFLRFRGLNFAYNIPGFNLNSGKSVIKGANLYVNFHNLAVWSPWNGVDPEDNNNISLVEYPNPRMIVFGIDIKL